MRSRLERSRAYAAALVLWCLVATPVDAAQGGQTTTPGALPEIQDVERALEVVRADPALGLERKVATLRWHDDDQPEQPQTQGWLAWLGNFFQWLGESARLLVWVACGLLAAIIAIYVLRLARQRLGSDARPLSAAPTHVRDLDIRPASLPDDIGAAARQLWDDGEARRALALLYRGLLSALAHEFQAPVRESTTEGDSIALARGCLTVAGGEFAAGLVQTWSHAVYGGTMPDTARVHALCAGFAPALQSAAPATEAA